MSLKNKIKILSIIVISIALISAFVLIKCVDDKHYVENDKTHITKISNVKTTTVKLDGKNTVYQTNKDGKGVKIDKYEGNEECVIVPTEIDGKQVKEIDEKAFEKCNNLENIKIPVTLKDKVSDIEFFEVDKENSNDEYIQLKTTKEYSEDYILYMEQPEEERAKSGVIPEKFIVPIEEVYSSKMEELYSVSTLSETEMESSYDLRDYIEIEVEDQNPYGTCYAYAALTSAETNIALTRGEIIDFSEIHASVNSSGSGGSFKDIENYYNSDIGPVYEVDWSKNNLEDNTSQENVDLIKKYLAGKIITSEQLSMIQSEMQETEQIEKAIQVTELPSISYEDKNDVTKQDEVSSARLIIKNHIKTYGSLYAPVNSGAIITNYKGKCVLNYKGEQRSDHAVSIIGWDDHFSKEKFPIGNRPEKDGAYLVLNSWGEDWGDEKGYFWVSYEDRWIEYGLNGVCSSTLVGEEISLESFDIKDIDTNEKLINNNILKGKNIRLNYVINSVNDILVDDVFVKLRTATEDVTSKANTVVEKIGDNNYSITTSISTKELAVGTYVIEVQYGEEIISKSITINSNIFDYEINEDGETITIISYNGEEKNIVLPEEYLGYNVNGIGDRAFYNNTTIQSITVYNNIVNIDTNIIKKGVIIYGNSGTAIETYASKNGYAFVEIGTEIIKEDLWELNLLTNTLEINGEINDYTSSSIPWRVFNRSIYNVKINVNINKIGNYAFYECSNLSNIGDLSNVTTIGKYAFYGCSSLTSIGDLTNVTSIGDRAFYGCSNLTSIGNLTNITIIGGSVFSGCSSLTSIGDLTNVTSIGEYAFYECSSLTSIGDLTKVTSIGDSAFNGCSSLISIRDLTNVTSIGRWSFGGCSSLTSIGELPSLTSIGSCAFYECCSLTGIEGLTNITNIGDSAFFKCISMTNIADLTKLETIGEEAFNKCNSLINIGEMPNVTSIGDSAFYECSSLTSIGNMPKVTSIGISTFGECNSLISIGNLTSVTSIGKSAFGKCSSLASIGELNNVASIGGMAFYECSSLTSIGNLQHITSIESFAFGGCSSLTSIGNLTNVTTIATYAFYACGNLTSIGNLTNVTSIDNFSFYGCTSLNKLVIGKNLESIGNYAFSSYKNLTICGYKDSVIEKYAHNKSISFVVIDEIFEYIYDNTNNTAVLECPKVELPNETEIPNRVAKLNSNGTTLIYTVIGIGDNAFKNITHLKKIQMPNSVTKIGKEAFLGCTALTQIEIPESVEIIDTNAFSGSGIRKIEVNGKNTDINTNGFGENDITGETIEVYGYANSKADTYVYSNRTKENGVYNLDFIAIDIKGVAIKTKPTNTNYVKGSNLNLTGGKITATYNNGSKQDISMTDETVNVTGYNPETLGEQTLTVTYKGYTVQFKVVVIETLIESKKYVITRDDNNNYIENVSENTKIEEFKKNITYHGDIKIYINGVEIKDVKTKLTTGSVVEVTLNQKKETYNIVVTGDITGDGSVNEVDLLMLARYIAGFEQEQQRVRGAYLRATDILRDYNFAVNTDLLKFARVLVGLDSL